MSGEHDLQTLLCGMSAQLVEGVYVFVTIPEGAMPQDLTPRMVFRESEGVTLIVLQDEAVAHRLPHEFPSRMITLNVHSSLDAVGFIALIATKLAAAGMGVNPVAGFFHDHIFIPEARAEDAMNLLQDLADQGSETAAF
ncbi:MAG: ACT domain-containing protein [Planktotalea sp.]|jgi:hypothetical protein|uniref:ACT domain-containing protein n=1 Tax=Planktotalea sp. TaxID=2029877 RepID=UPI000EE61BE3|nr:ACT domain-containing protein [Planktotalea sp.]MBT5820850.1 ACT domain-containing protein [Paracoccaceae bacterium]MDG1075213.1 ACT domain-containing protein [Planktotalea sp.]HCW84991.1 ribonuclease H family protein [Paracoccaceae bacterium]